MASAPTASRPGIPLANLTNPQAANPTPTSNTALQSTNAAPPAAPQAPSALQQTSNFSPRRTKWLNEAFSFANGIGTFALITAIVFGIGAWVGMKIQISQGGKNMDLAIWTACADHEAIQGTKLCKSIMAKDFSQFEKREEEERQPKDVTVIVKRGIDDFGSASSDRVTVPIQPSRLEKLLSRISPSDRNHIDVDTKGGRLPDPSIRATIFPLVNLLIKPVSWASEFIEYMFLVTIYCVHKVFSWTTTAVIFCLQAWIYSLVEKVCRAVLSVLDHLIVQLLPDWLPTLLVSDIASMLCLTALRSYWYSTRYLTSLKWLLIFRVGVWLIFSAPQACYRLWKAGQLRFEKRHTQWGPTTSTTRFGGFLQRSSAPALGVDLSTSSALPALPAPSLRPLPSSKTSALPAPPSSSSVRSLAPSQKRIGGVGAEPDGGLSPEELFYKQLKPRGRSKSRSLSNGNVGLHSRARATPVE